MTEKYYEPVCADSFLEPIMEESVLYILDRTREASRNSAYLEKFLYFCDFDFYEKHEMHLFGLTYKKFMSGICEDLPKILASLAGKKKIKEASLLFSDFFSMKWNTLAEPDTAVIGDTFLKHIDWEIDRFSETNPSALNNYLFSDIPWMASEFGDYLDYEMVFYRDKQHAVSEDEPV